MGRPGIEEILSSALNDAVKQRRLPHRRLHVLAAQCVNAVAISHAIAAFSGVSGVSADDRDQLPSPPWRRSR